MPIQTTDFAIANSWQLVIPKCPNVAFFTNTCSIPSLGIDAISTGTRLAPIQIPGSKLKFETLDVSFIVDKQMSNYVSLYTYLRGLAPLNDLTPTGLNGTSDYQQYIANKPSLNDDTCDVSLIVNDNYNNPLLQIVYHDAFPTSLALPKVDAGTGDAKPLIATATFYYTYFDINNLY